MCPNKTPKGLCAEKFNVLIICLNKKIEKNCQWVYFQVKKIHGSYKQTVWETLSLNFSSENP